MKWSSTLDFDAATAAIVRGARAGVIEVADDIFDESQSIIPDDPETGAGDLKRSGEVTPQHTARDAVAAISYGTDHAVYQHERLDYDHPHGGTAKYLERPLSAAQRTAKARVVARIKRELS